MSPDGKTYTFELQDGVTFHDGTPMDSEAVKASFEREIAVKGGPSYMLAQVDSIETPDPQTVVVNLNQPVAAFLDYNASMYGPKIVSPTAVKQNTEGDDNATKWLSENEAGTGPYQLDSYKPSGPFVLKRYDDYWGEPAKTETIEITVVPDIGDQILQLRSGQLDILTHGVDPQQIPSLEATTTSRSSSSRPRSGPCWCSTTRFRRSTPTPRRARRSSPTPTCRAPPIRSTAIPQTRCRHRAPLLIDPADGSAPGQRRPARRRRPRRRSGSATRARDRPAAAGRDRPADLEAQGWNVKLQADSVAAQFGYASDPTKAPEAAITTLNPDAAHPAAWLKPIYSRTVAASTCSGSPTGARRPARQRARRRPTRSSRRTTTRRRPKPPRQLVRDRDRGRNDVIAAHSDITGFTHVPVYIWVVKLADLERE